MYFIVPFIFFVVIVWVIGLSTGAIRWGISQDRFPPKPSPESKPSKPSTPVKPKSLPYIKLGNQYFKLEPSEVAKAKKDGYTIVYR